MTVFWDIFNYCDDKGKTSLGEFTCRKSTEEAESTR